jgi:hypothetical protein
MHCQSAAHKTRQRAHKESHKSAHPPPHTHDRRCLTVLAVLVDCLQSAAVLWTPGAPRHPTSKHTPAGIQLSVVRVWYCAPQQAVTSGSPSAAGARRWTNSVPNGGQLSTTAVCTDCAHGLALAVRTGFEGAANGASTEPCKHKIAPAFCTSTPHQLPQHPLGSRALRSLGGASIEAARKR